LHVLGKIHIHAVVKRRHDFDVHLQDRPQGDITRKKPNIVPPKERGK